MLPYLVFRNGAHIVALCEANDPVGGIARHQHIARDDAMLGMVVNAEITAPSVAIFIRGTHAVGSFIELLCQHQHETEQKTKKENMFWIFHACIFRLSFGRVTSGELVDPSSGIWTTLPSDNDPNLVNRVTPHPAPLASTRDDEDWHITEVQGKKDIESCDLLKPISGADNHDVRRLGLAEVRCAVFHISSYAWSHPCAELCERWVEFIASCISHQVDFIQGDGNLFTQRNFKKDAHSDFRSCILIDLLEKFLGQVNLCRSAMNRISYNVVSSSQAAEYIKAQENDPHADCDPMLCISLCYGNQTMVTEDRSKQQSASADGYAGSSFDNEIMLNDVEQPKHLMVYDLGLGPKAMQTRLSILP